MSAVEALAEVLDVHIYDWEDHVCNCGAKMTARTWTKHTAAVLVAAIRSMPAELPDCEQCDGTGFVGCWNPGGPCPIPNEPDCECCGDCNLCATPPLGVSPETNGEQK